MVDNVSLQDIYTPSDLYGRIGSKSTLLAMERAGKFPKRYYFDADSPHPKRPFWLKSEVDSHLAERIQKAEEARLKAGQLGARLIQAKQLKAA